MATKYLASLAHFIPELIITITMLALILLESFYPVWKKRRRTLFVVGIIGLSSSLFYLFSSVSVPGLEIFTGSLIIDPYSTMLKIVMVMGTIGVFYLVTQSKDISYDTRGEFKILSLGVLVGGMLLVSAANMLTLYIGIETLSIISYALASLKKNDDRSSEAGIKYLLYGGLTAGIMLYGLGHIFGMVGTISFTEMAKILPTMPNEKLVILIPAFFMFFAGLGYKIASFPFHMWSPDVYEGSPIPVTSFFAIVPKIAGIGSLLRITHILFSNSSVISSVWIGLLTIVAALTMTVGNVTAINQRSVKRMLAFSSISHAGVMLLGILAINEIGVSSIVFYSITYLFMTLAAFYVVSIISDQYNNDHFERFSGLINRYPLMAICLTIVMFSLAGVPPFSGFIAKFNIFSAIITKKYYTLAIVAGLNSVVGVYYYLKIVRYMMFNKCESNEPIEGFTKVNQGIIIALTIPVVLLGIFWAPVMELSKNALIFIP